MKNILKFSLLLLILLVVKKEIVYANYNDSFYLGNYIDNEFIKRSDIVLAYYDEHRFISRTSDNHFVYSLEPFVGLKEYEMYQGYTDDYAKRLSLSKDIWNKIRLISYYGYGYGNHTARKWYTITQIMIWKLVYPNGIFEWTNGMSSTVISKYENEIEEINNLVENHTKLPKYANKTYNVSTNSSFNLEDTSFDISDFEVTITPTININKNTNSVTGISSEEGKYVIQFLKKDNRFSDLPIIYTDDNNQNVMAIGNNDDIVFKTTINIESGSLKINMLDKDNNNNKPNGNSKFNGTKYGLYNSKKELLKELVIDERGHVTEENLDYGSYCVKQIESGVGYNIDEEEHCFRISHSKLNIELNLYNEVVKKEVTINMSTDGENSDVFKSSNISFSITGLTHDYNNTITTNQEGKTSVLLPYGKYLFKQLNTLPSYNKTDDFTVNINSENDNYNYEIINKKELVEQEKEQVDEKNNKNKNEKKDKEKIKKTTTYEISVPNTNSNQDYSKEIIFLTNAISYFFVGNKYYKKSKNIFI